jgi:hypothetical protein
LARIQWGLTGYHKEKAEVSQENLQARRSGVWQYELNQTKRKSMTQITDIGLLKHHRVDYGSHIGEPASRPRKSYGGSILAIALLAFVVNVVVGIVA